MVGNFGNGGKKKLILYLLKMEKIRQIIKKRLNEMISEQNESNFDYPSFIRKTLKLIYEPLGLWGHAPNPNEDCETGLGVINIFPHSEQDAWSVLNRFDTNFKVKNRLKSLFEQYSKTKGSEKDFYDWIERNKVLLFGPNGKYTQQLVDLNMETIILGNKNEEYAVKILQEKFPDVRIRRFCSGDVRDTKKGIDITVEHPSRSFNVQVKPYKNILFSEDPEGEDFYEVESNLKESKYSEKNVNVFMFVNSQLEEYILFRNKKSKITQIDDNIIRFFEKPVYTNMSLENKKSDN
jgi:hypothetical protein